MEEKIIYLLQTQDKDAINLLHDHYSAAVYGVVLRIVGSPYIAQNILQDCFVKAWRYGPTYDASKGRLFTWLMKIAKNTAIDATRCNGWKMEQRTDTLSSIMDFESLPIDSDTIGLRELVLDLDPKHRVLVEMVYFQGYTHREIEQKLSIPLGTVKNRLRAAMCNLRMVFNM